MNSSTSKPTLPWGWRIAILLLLVGFYWFVQRDSRSAHTEAQTKNPPIQLPWKKGERPSARQTEPPASADQVGNKNHKSTAQKPAASTTPTPGTAKPLPPLNPSATAKSTPTNKTPTAEKPVPEKSVPNKTAEEPGEKPQSLVISKVKLKDQNGRIIFEGDIDLQPTLDRIEAGKLLDRFPHDGSNFQNRERRLPKQPPNYYKEYVVPTAGQNGPGPQRLVIGKEGEIYYSHDHYKTFKRVK